MVVSLRSSGAGQLVVSTTSGMQSRFIIVGTDRRTPSTARQVLMQVDRAGRGLYYAVEPISGQAGRARLRQISFDDVRQSPEMIRRMSLSAHSWGARAGFSRWSQRVLRTELRGLRVPLLCNSDTANELLQNSYSRPQTEATSCPNWGLSGGYRRHEGDRTQHAPRERLTVTPSMRHNLTAERRLREILAVL